MLSYIYSWLYPEQPLPLKTHPLKPQISLSTSLITESDLLKVNLKPFNVIPSARNMPNMDAFTLQVLSKAHLKDILAVKLKKTDVKIKESCYEPRHPVLRELLMKTSKF